MIYIINGFETKLEEEKNIFSIYSYERIMIKPCERKIITLPIRTWNPTRKLVTFILDKSLSLNGLQCVWNNLNDPSSLLSIELLLYNSNLDYELLLKKKDSISSIIGSPNKFNIPTNQILGKIYFSR